MNIGIIGAGISGIAAAQELHLKHKVTLVDSEDSIGGHSHTIKVNDGTNIDTGFIVYNDRNYPGFSAFLEALGVKSSRTSMSFSYSENNLKLEYAGTIQGLFPRFRALMDRGHIGLMWSIYKYSRKLDNLKFVDLEKNCSVVQLLKTIGCPDQTIEKYFLPIASAIWSCDANNVRDIPANTFIRFFSNHGLFNITNRPKWYSIDNGSRAYLEAFRKNFSGTILTETRAVSCFEMSDKVVIKGENDKHYEFDVVLLATPADKSNSIFGSTDKKINSILSSYTYTSNRVVLHMDTDFMPANRRLWASWNFISHSNGRRGTKTFVSYYMNQLQNLITKIPYFVTLNPPWDPKSDKIIFDTTYNHPMLTHDEETNEMNFNELNTKDRVYFCGSYLGYGFHEDGFSSGVKAAKLIDLRKLISS